MKEKALLSVDIAVYDDVGLTNFDGIHTGYTGAYQYAVDVG